MLTVPFFIHVDVRTTLLENTSSSSNGGVHLETKSERKRKAEETSVDDHSTGES